MVGVDACTVGELLGIEPEAVEHIALYEVGAEPTSKPNPKPTSRAPRLARRVLDAYRRDAEAGASDADIARTAGCTVAQVRRWRLARGLHRVQGRPTTRARTTAFAMALLGAPFEPVITPVKSVVDGRFEAPRYLVREALDYSAFVRCVRALRDAGFAVDTVSSGLGVRVVDIERAEKIARRS